MGALEAKARKPSSGLAQDIIVSRLRSIDPITTTGILVSIVVPLLLFVLGRVDVVAGTTISLLGITITLAIDIIARINSLEENTLLSVGLSRKLATNRWATDLIVDIIEAWDKIERAKYHPLLYEIARLRTQDARDQLADISSGEIVVGEPDHRFLSLVAEEARDSIKAISLVSVEFYRTAAGKRYLEENITAAERGVDVTRIFLCEEVDSATVELMRMMKAGGINVMIAKCEELSDGFRGAFAISDDRLVWTPVFDSKMFFQAHHISTKPEDLMRAMDRFERVRFEAEKYDGS